MMRLFKFENQIGNYLRGYFHFAAEDMKEAIKLARKFAKQSDQKNRNYKVEFDYASGVEVELIKGYIEKLR